MMSITFTKQQCYCTTTTPSVFSPDGIPEVNLSKCELAWGSNPNNGLGPPAPFGCNLRTRRYYHFNHCNVGQVVVTNSNVKLDKLLSTHISGLFFSRALTSALTFGGMLTLFIKDNSAKICSRASFE